MIRACDPGPIVACVNPSPVADRSAFTDASLPSWRPGPVREAVVACGCRDLTLDVSHLTSATTEGLKALVATARQVKHAGGQFSLANDMSQLGGLFTDVAHKLGGYYTLQYKSVARDGDHLLGVTVIALPSPPVFLSPKGLQHVGPRAFGYDLDFKSVFDAPHPDPPPLTAEG